MEILDPDRRRISVIFVPLRPIIQPTISDGMEMFCVRRFDAVGDATGSRGDPGGDFWLLAASPFWRRDPL